MNLISIASTAFKTATTWGQVNEASLLDSELVYTPLTTDYTANRSSAFTPGAVEIDGVAVKLASRVASPTGAIGLRLILSSDNSEVVGSEVVINVSDLPVCDTTNKDGGWIFFKFASPITLVAATDYKIELETSSASQVNLYTDAVSKNFSRMLRTTTTQAPEAGNILHVMGERTGTGTGNDLTVTMDNDATTDFGAGTNDLPALTISDRGILNYAYAAVTDYYLKLSGDAIVYSGGIFTVGTVGAPIPRDSTAVLEFDPTSDGGMGLIARNGATLTIQGLSRTVGKNEYFCRMTATEPYGETELAVDRDTGWLDNDEIAIAPTDRSYNHYDKGACNGNAAAAVLTVDGFAGAGGGLNYEREFLTGLGAHIILLTRNVKIRSASSSNVTYLNFQPTAVIDIDWAEFYYLGQNATNKRGFNILTNTGSLALEYCSIHDTEDYAVYIDGPDCNNIDINYNVFYRCCTAGGYGDIYVKVQSGAKDIVISNNISLGSGKAGYYFFHLNLTFTNNVVSGAYGYSSRSIYLSAGSSADEIGTINNLEIYCNYYDGIVLDTARGTIGSLTVYRNSSVGISLIDCTNLIIDTVSSFGNTYGILEFTGEKSINITLIDAVDDSEASYNSYYSLNFDADYPAINLLFIDCAFGETRAPSTSCFYLAPGLPVYISALLMNCFLGGTIFNYQDYLEVESKISCQNYNQVSNTYKTFKRGGIIESDTTADHVDGGTGISQKLTPEDADPSLESGPKRAAVDSGGTVTFSVKVRASDAGDGAVYNGQQPRLILKRNDVMGVTADTVLDTATSASEGAFETLTGTTPAASQDGVFEVVVDCGRTGYTTGFINVDSWSV